MSSAMIHYGGRAMIYEGAEAHHFQHGKLRLWNIRSNAARMRQGCERMLKPPYVPPGRLSQVRDGGPHSKVERSVLRPLTRSSPDKMVGLAPSRFVRPFVRSSVRSVGRFFYPPWSRAPSPAPLPPSSRSSALSESLDGLRHNFFPASPTRDRARPPAPRGTAAAPTSRPRMACDVMRCHVVSCGVMRRPLDLDSRPARGRRVRVVGAREPRAYVPPYGSGGAMNLLAAACEWSVPANRAHVPPYGSGGAMHLSAAAHLWPRAAARARVGARVLPFLLARHIP